MQTVRDDDFLRLNLFSDFIENFVVPSQRERWHYLLSKPKRRHELLEEARPGFAFEPRFLEILAPENQKPQRIFEILKRKGAPDECFVFSFEPQFRAPIDLRAALEKTVGTCENTLLICPNARLAFWESEGCERAILHHPLALTKPKLNP